MKATKRRTHASHGLAPTVSELPDVMGMPMYRRTGPAATMMVAS